MRALLVACCCALLALAPRPAAADPQTLRHGGTEPGLVFQAGWPQAGVGWWMRPGLGAALTWRLPAAAVEASVGGRWRAPLGPGPWALDGFLAGGLLVPTLDPGLALTATPAARIGRYGQAEFDLGLALPVELQVLDERLLRLPVLLEAGAGVDLGPLELGLRSGFGPVLCVPGTLGFVLQWSLWGRMG